MPQNTGKAALHTHTKFSDGIVTPTELVKAAQVVGISVLAITDHDTMKGVDEAKIAGEEYGIEIIPGEEVTTGSIFKQRHIIALDIKGTIPHSKSLEWTTDAIHEQGGFVIIPHPATGAPSLTQDELKTLLQNQKIDGIEIINGRNNNKEKLKTINITTLGAEIGASDSHFGKLDLMLSYTEFPGKTAQDLLKAIKNRQTVAQTTNLPHIPQIDRFKQNIRAQLIVGTRRYILNNL